MILFSSIARGISDSRDRASSAPSTAEVSAWSAKYCAKYLPTGSSISTDEYNCSKPVHHGISVRRVLQLYVWVLLTLRRCVERRNGLHNRRIETSQGVRSLQDFFESLRRRVAALLCGLQNVYHCLNLVLKPAPRLRAEAVLEMSTHWHLLHEVHEFSSITA